MTERRFVLLMLLPAMLFLGFLVVYPVALLVYNSFFDVKLIDPSSRVWVGLGNYLEALTSKRILESALRTLRYSAFALFFELVFGLGAALLFAAIARHSHWHRTIFALPLMLSPIVAACSGDFSSSATSASSTTGWRRSASFPIRAPSSGCPTPTSSSTRWPSPISG